MDYFDIEKKLKFKVPHRDQYTLFRAILLSKCQSDSQYERNNQNRQQVIDQLSAQRKKLKRSATSWKKAVNDLLAKCGIEKDLDTYGMEYIENIAAHYGEYNIQVYSRQLPAKVYSLQYESDPTSEMEISIGLFNNYFNVFSPTVSTIGKYICYDCKKTYTRKTRHNCLHKCSRCHSNKCINSFGSERIKCDECGVVFHSQHCFDNHKSRQGRKRKNTCDTFKKCKKCEIYYKPENMKVPHICHQKSYCHNCCSHVNPETHDCCWIPPDEKAIAKKMLKQEKFKIIIYDFESVVLKDIKVLNSYDEQYANYCVYSLMCQDCFTKPIDDPCNNCGQYRIHTIKWRNANSRTDVMDQFIHLLLNDRTLDGAYAIAHNASRFDIHFLIMPLLKRNILPQIAKEGLKIFQMKTMPKKDDKFNTITFKDSCLFLPMSLSSMPTAFGFPEEEKGTFPYLFNHPSNYGRIFPTLPPTDYYRPQGMTTKDSAKFFQWYAANKTKKFDFDYELDKYCVQDVKILHQGVSSYIKSSLELTGFNPIVHCCTFASFSFFIIKHSYMKLGQVGIIPENGYHNNDRQSKLAIKYIQWIEQQEGKEYQYILRGGEFSFKHIGRTIKVDAYHAESNTIVEILGCFIHGCPKHTKQDSKHPFHYKKMREVYDETMDRLQIILAYGYHLKIVWEHDIHIEMGENPQMRQFFKEVVHHGRLIIRDSFFGARTQNYVLRADPEPEKNRTLIHLDCCSMYPYILKNTKLPMGQPEVLTKDFRPITLPLPYKGFYMIDILPPRRLRFPVIPMRSGGKLLFPLCATCARNQINSGCTHEEEEERIIHAIVIHEELERALENGYKVIKVYEVWNWPDEKWGTDLFREFINKFIKVKMEASGWPRSDMTEDEKDKMIADIQEYEGITIEKNKVEKNPPKRQISKLACNSAFGKFGEKSSKQYIVFYDIDSDDIPEVFVNDELEATSTELIDRTMIITYKKLEDFHTPQPYTNCVIASIVTARGRLMLHAVLDRLQERALYCDTDSVVMISEPGEDNLDDIQGTFMGQWQSEVPEGFHITSFASTGPKVYGYKLLNDTTGEERAVVKARGITIDSKASALVNFESLKRMAENLAAGQTDTITTSRAMITKTLGHIYTKDREKNLRPVMNKLRYAADYSTLPYGWKD